MILGCNASPRRARFSLHGLPRRGATSAHFGLPQRVIFALLAFATALSAGEPADVRNTYEAVYLGDKKIGYAHMAIDRLEVEGQTVFRIDADSVISMQRFNDTIKMGMSFQSYELTDGQLYAFDATIDQPGQKQVTHGRLDGNGKFSLHLETLGKKQDQSIDWSKEMLGPRALDQMLRNKPFALNEVRKMKTFIPAVNESVEVVFKGLGKRKTKLLDGREHELSVVQMDQKIRTATGAAGQKLPSTTYYLDDKGEPLKSELPLLGVLTMTSYKVVDASALAGAGGGAAVDFGFQTLVKVAERIPNARKAAALTYRLETADADAADAFKDFDYQKVVRREGSTLWLRVERRTPKLPSHTSDDGDFSKPNGFIQSDDPEIAAKAKETVGAATDPWKKCQQLERWVDEHMSHGDFSVGFATAADTMRSLKGDCTEHAVLLAALCRAVDVPAKVAMGLVYVDSLQAFGYHMWTEVKINDEWYALDGTLGEGSVGGEHIKIADGSLKGTSALSTLLPVFQVMGKLKITVEKAE